MFVLMLWWFIQFIALLIIVLVVVLIATAVIGDTTIKEVAYSLKILITYSHNRP